jgi:hypothetical protein
MITPSAACSTLSIASQSGVIEISTRQIFPVQYSHHMAHELYGAFIRGPNDLPFPLNTFLNALLHFCDYSVVVQAHTS